MKREKCWGHSCTFKHVSWKSRANRSHWSAGASVSTMGRLKLIHSFAEEKVIQSQKINLWVALRNPNIDYVVDRCSWFQTFRYGQQSFCLNNNFILNPNNKSAQEQTISHLQMEGSYLLWDETWEGLFSRLTRKFVACTLCWALLVLRAYDCSICSPLQVNFSFIQDIPKRTRTNR